jgi:hypothetical protein
MAPNSYESLKSDVGCLVFVISMFLVFVVIPFFMWLGAVIGTILGVLVGGPLLGAILGCICLLPAFVFVLLRSPFAFRIYSSRLDGLEQELAAVRERIAAHKEKTESLGEADRDAAQKSAERLLAKQEKLLDERANLVLALCQYIKKKRERLVASKIRYLETADKRSSKRTGRFLESTNKRIAKHEEQEALLMERGGTQVKEIGYTGYDWRKHLTLSEKELPFDYESLQQAYLVIGCRKILAFARWFIGALAILGGIFAAVEVLT